MWYALFKGEVHYLILAHTASEMGTQVKLIANSMAGMETESRKQLLKVSRVIQSYVKQW